MPTVVTHRKVRIVLLERGESVAAHCRRGDIAIVAEADGWWTHFVGADGVLDSYEEAFATRDAALWAAKAAAEYGLE